MGKKNPAQRTKGNAKASSSARAAELLSTSGAPTYSFGFGGAAAAAGAAAPDGNHDSPAASIMPTAASVPFAAVATASLDDDDASSAHHLDGDVKLLLKKMTKKDSITKCKALTEFIAYLDDDGDGGKNGSDKNNVVDGNNDVGNDADNNARERVDAKRMSADNVKALIPFWPRIYNALSMDSDRKVRELTQQAMLQLVKPERKKLLAPHLKTFLGAWMLALVSGVAVCAFSPMMREADLTYNLSLDFTYTCATSAQRQRNVCATSARASNSLFSLSTLCFLVRWTRILPPPRPLPGHSTPPSPKPNRWKPSDIVGKKSSST